MLALQRDRDQDVPDVIGLLLGVAAVELDDVPAELRQNRLGNLPWLEGQRGFLEYRDHRALGVLAQVAALDGARGVIGDPLGERGEVLSRSELLSNRDRAVA